MNKCVKTVLLSILTSSLAGCAFFEFADNQKYVVDLGNGESYIKWNLVENNNEFHPVSSAYFEFSKDSFKYYENGLLKKEGKNSAKYFGIDDGVTQMTICLNTINSIRDDGRLYCFTEDEKNDLHQFTIRSMGYQIQPVRTGGVPVRDYHLSNMPYAFGTYVKEGSQRYTYQHEKIAPNYNGTFVDRSGNQFYFANNSYKSNASFTEYTVYFHYENATTLKPVEGTLSFSEYDDWELGHRKVALLYVMHGQSEASKEKGVSEFPDYELKDFTYDETSNSISFTEAKYFDDAECDYLPSNFVAGSYTKTQQ